MPHWTDDYLTQQRQRFVGKTVTDTLRTEIEQAFAGANLHIDHETTNYTMMMDPNRVIVSYNDQQVITRITNN